MYPEQYPSSQAGAPPQGPYPGAPPQGPYPPPSMGPAPALANPRVQDALGQVDLLAGEQVMFVLQGDGFFLGTSPVVKAIANFRAFMVTLTGGYMRTFLVATNQRLLVIKANQLWCGCGRTRAVHTIALAGVKEVGSDKVTQMCCVHTRTVSVRSMTQAYNVVIKKQSDVDVRTFVTNLSAVLVAHTNRAGV